MFLSDKDLDVIYGVFCELLKQPYDKLNRFLGSETIKQMFIISDKLILRDYCERHDLKYEDLTYDDRVDAYHDAFEE